MHIEPIYFISPQPQDHSHFYNIVEEACKSNIKLFQFRNKTISDEKLKFKVAKQCQDICNLYNTKFIINDDVALTLELNAAGIHLGQKDMSIIEAKKQLGNKIIYGASSNTIDQIIQAEQQGYNYTGIGPYKISQTKLNLNPIIDHEKWLDIGKMNFKIPLYVIGGIEIDDIIYLKKLGLQNFALSSGIVKAIKNKELNKLLDLVYD